MFGKVNPTNMVTRCVSNKHISNFNYSSGTVERKDEFLDLSDMVTFILPAEKDSYTSVVGTANSGSIAPVIDFHRFSYLKLYNLVTCRIFLAVKNWKEMADNSESVCCDNDNLFLKADNYLISSEENKCFPDVFECYHTAFFQY